MRIWFDTEFIEDGKTIDLISIGMVREDGARLYFENRECDFSKASPWVKENVLPHISAAEDVWRSRSEIADAILEFAGEKPEFWAYYADYDWVVLCQLYGRMIDLPHGWPMYCRDVKQFCDDLGNPELIKQTEGPEHDALADAVWTKAAWEYLRNRSNGMDTSALSSNNRGTE